MMGKNFDMYSHRWLLCWGMNLLSSLENSMLQQGFPVIPGRRLGLLPAVPIDTFNSFSRKLLWLSDTEHHKGYGVDFLSISLHAVSRDPEAYPLPCIYTQIESRETDRDEEPDSGDNEDLDLSRVTEMCLVPSDSSILDNLFKVLCECAELNPELYGEQEGEDDWILNAEEMANLDPEQDGEGGWEFEEELGNPIGYSNHNITHNILELRIDDERFEDAEELEHISQPFNSEI